MTGFGRQDSCRWGVRLMLLLALGRLALGVALLFPAAGTIWLGTESHRPTVRYLNKNLASREIALGAGMLAVRDAAARRRLLMIGGLCDSWDGVAALTAGGEVRGFRRLVAAVVAFSGAVSGLLAARLLTEPAVEVDSCLLDGLVSHG
jgi:hypothetical protein